MLPSSTSTWNPPISFEEVAECFTLPIVEASAKLGICSTTLKRMCREHGIPRWPYRKVMAGKSIEEIKREAVAQAADDGQLFAGVGSELDDQGRLKNASEDGRPSKGFPNSVLHTSSSALLWGPSAPIAVHGRSTRDCLPGQSNQAPAVAAWRSGSGGETPLDKVKVGGVDAIQHPTALPLLYPPQGTLPGLSLPFPSGPPHVASPFLAPAFSNYEIPATSSSTRIHGARPCPLSFGNNHHLSIGYPQTGMPRLTHKWWRKSNNSVGKKNIHEGKERTSAEGAVRTGEANEPQPQQEPEGGPGGNREPDSSSEVAKPAAVASALGRRKDSSNLHASRMAASLWRKRKERAAQAARSDSRLAVYRGYGRSLREGDLDVLKFVFGKFVSRDWEDLGARRVLSQQ